MVVVSVSETVVDVSEVTVAKVVVVDAVVEVSEVVVVEVCP